MFEKPANIDSVKFGQVFSNHMKEVDWHIEKGWEKPVISLLHDFSLHPASNVLHYAIELFEGMKAYRGVDNKIRIFRPEQNIQLCFGTICHHKVHPQINEEVELPTEVLLTTHKVSAVLWSNGFVVQKLTKTCPPKEICSLVKCYFCWEIIGNPQCMPKEAIFATAAMIYIILMIIHYLIKIVKRSAKLLKYVTQMILFVLMIVKRIANFVKNIILKTIRFCLKAIPKRQRNNREDIEAPKTPPVVRHNPFLYVPRSPTETIVTMSIVICLIGYVSTCSEVASISAIQESCLLESNGITCTFNQHTLITLSPQGQTSCLILKNNNNENIGMVTLTVSKVASYCKPSTLYYTREYIIKSKSSKRCRSHEISVKSHRDTIKVVNATNLDPLLSKSDVKGFVRETEISIGPENSLVKKEVIVPISFLWLTFSWNHYKVTLASMSLPTVPFLNTKFVTDYRRIAVVDASVPEQQIPGTVGDFQCRTFDDAKKFNCNFPSHACRCQILESKTNCVCQADQFQKLFNNGDQLLPVQIGGITFEGWERTVRALCHEIQSAKTFNLHFQQSKIDVTCKVQCGNSESESELKGDFAFVGHYVHSSYYIIAAEEMHAASSLGFNF
uniref:Branched-chain-amino-acid transaminase n=1 Tax=Panagrolaimus davidi TaxID=227884 RepID=A0A914P838_9BILA